MLAAAIKRKTANTYPAHALASFRALGGYRHRAGEVVVESLVEVLQRNNRNMEEEIVSNRWYDLVGRI